MGVETGCRRKMRDSPSSAGSCMESWLALTETHRGFCQGSKSSPQAFGRSRSAEPTEPSLCLGWRRDSRVAGPTKPKEVFSTTDSSHGPGCAARECLPADDWGVQPLSVSCAFGEGTWSLAWFKELPRRLHPGPELQTSRAVGRSGERWAGVSGGRRVVTCAPATGHRT